MKKCFSLLLLSFVVAVGLFAQRNTDWAVPVNAIAVQNLYKVDDGVFRCAQPDASAFAELQQMGIHSVLNLRYLCRDDKNDASTGLTLYHIKMIAGNCELEKIVEALRIIHNRQGPIVIHCKHGSDRTGLVIALYRVLFQGWSKEAAVDELENGGYGFHTIYVNISSLIRNMDEALLKKIVMQK